MFVNLLIWLLLVALAIFCGWLAVRAWRARRWFVRFPGGILASLLTLLLIFVVVLGAIGLYKIYVPVGGVVKDIQVQATPEMVQRGEHFASVFCVDCHSTTGELPLSGGVDLAKDIPIPIGSFVSINLTPAGPLKNWSDGQILRVLREGVSPDGHTLAAMNATNIRYMSDDDLMALIAYLRSQPPDVNPTLQPPDQYNFLGVLVTGAALVPAKEPVTATITTPQKAATAEYGQYILSYMDCRSCHGLDLLGGKNALSPNGPGLRPVRAMTKEQFITMMRTGARPDGHILQAPMPWKTVGRMDDVELEAVYQYLKSIP